ncbi:MAG TPA: hypothetical protein VIV40_24255 [Kofleriaceae bacterium]
MALHDEADALREQVDHLALGPSTVEDWRLADAKLFHAMMEGQLEVQALQGEMIKLVKTTRPSWCWFEKHAAVRELVELLDDLRVLRMCVRSRIYELEAGDAQPAIA